MTGKPMADSIRRTITMTAAIILSWVALAQNRTTIRGVIIDDDNLPVPGAVIYEKGKTSNVATSDENGHFTLSVEVGKTICVSCMGYKAEEIPATIQMSIVLHDEMEKLDAVFVVGYGVQKKESVVGAISQIDNETIMNSGQTNITNAIAGKLSGVLTMQSSGTPGANDASILIRGVSSWNGSEPLVMVDGVERPFNTLDPNEVASISVLKDASATAVFGAKGANGVILVTTRGGQKGKPKLSVNYSHGFNIPALLPAHQDGCSTASAYNVAMKNSGQYSMLFSDYELGQFRHPDNAINSLRYPDNNWYDLMLRKVADTNDANINLSGGTDKARYFISLGYKGESSIYKVFNNFDNINYSYDRLNFRANIDVNASKSTTISLKIGEDINIKKAPDSSPTAPMYSGSTIAYPAYYPAWLLNEIPDTDYPEKTGDRLVSTALSSFGNYYGNPYNKLNIASYNQNTVTKIYTDILVRQDLDILTQGLSLNAKVSFSTTMERTSEYATSTRETYYLDWDLFDEGLVNPWVSSKASTSVIENPPSATKQGGITNYLYTFYWEGSVNYDRTVNKHHITGLALFNQKIHQVAAQFQYRNQGLVGRATYDYDGRYLLEMNVGYTGSEQFAPSNRFGFFPSVALGYVASKERWWKQALPWWSKFKIRYSDGLVGNDQTSQRWLYYSSFTKSDGLIYEDAAANTKAQWERAHKRDLGIEMSWLKNRLSLEVDLFDEQRTNMLVAPVVTYLVGVNSKMVNKGSMKKHGIEIECGWNESLKNGLTYNLSAMLSLNENRITNYEDVPYLPDYQRVAGKPYKGQSNGISLVDGGYYNTIDDIHTYPSYTDNWQYLPVGAYKYGDYTADNKIDSDDLHAVKGSQYPLALMSFGGGLRYKGWELNFLLYGNFGKWVNYNGSFEMEFLKAELKLSTAEANYWRPDNRESATHATLVYNGSAGHPMYTWAGTHIGETVTMGLVGHTWRNANYVTLKDLYLGYNLKSRKLEDLAGIKSTTFYVSGNNLLYFTNLIEGNPEIASFTTGYYPLMKTIKVGLKFNFN